MRRKKYSVVLFAIGFLLVSASYVWSQLRARVEEVVVPVNVRDTDGKLVTGLTKDDFIVTEDGVTQTLSTFSVDPSPLSAAIVVDDGMGGIALKRLVSVLNVMTSGFSPEEDEMASFRYDHFVWKLSDFTNDPKRIEKSFDELAKIAETRPALGEPGDPAAGGGPEWLRALGATITIGTTGPPSPNPTAADRPKPVPTSRVLHQAIQEAANALKARPESRRKIIFMISDGQVAGPGASRLMDQNIDSLLRSRIQVYSVATDYAIFEGDLSVLTAYARATGGDVFNGGSAKEMETAFARITEQARNQYVLRYTSSNEPRGSGGVFREINVRTRFPGQTVTHRRGYMQYPAR